MLKIDAFQDEGTVYGTIEFRLPMTNEIFAEMEKLVVTTNPSSFDTPEEAREWEEKIFPKDYVYGRGLAYL